MTTFTYDIKEVELENGTTIYGVCDVSVSGGFVQDVMGIEIFSEEDDTSRFVERDTPDYHMVKRALVKMYDDGFLDVPEYMERVG